jgi:hypothetical protein
MQSIGRSKKIWIEKIAIAVGLIGLSGLLYLMDYIIIGDFTGVTKYIAHHIAFLPIHALVLGILIEEILVWREKREAKRKLNMFLGIFFRQMGVDFYVAMAALVKNREELDRMIVVNKEWDHKRFKKAQLAIHGFNFDMDSDADKLENVFSILHERETEIMDMTRNPNLWEFEELYRALVALFHLIEESRFRGKERRLIPGVRQHLAKDVGKALRILLGLWLHYLEFLKTNHPVLFSFQAGVHNTVEPLMLDENWEE